MQLVALSSLGEASQLQNIAGATRAITMAFSFLSWKPESRWV